jgi:AraC-like DNA-binding protein
MDGRWLHDEWPWLASNEAYIAQLSISLAMAAGLIFMAVRRENLFEGVPPSSLDEKLPEIQPSGEPNHDPSVFARVEQALHQEALYTEPRLTRAELAAAANLDERQVSKAIRQATGQNFNDYVNTLRLQDVCAMLERVSTGQSRATMLEIAYTAGFSSKSVFNAAFKRAFGQTPTAWLVARRDARPGAFSAN